MYQPSIHKKSTIYQPSIHPLALRTSSDRTSSSWKIFLTTKPRSKPDAAAIAIAEKQPKPSNVAFSSSFQWVSKGMINTIYIYMYMEMYIYIYKINTKLYIYIYTYLCIYFSDIVEYNVQYSARPHQILYSFHEV